METEKENVQLEDLIGTHTLTGVTINTIEIPYYEQFEDAQTISFVLDGTTYTAVEDPNDGYRSTMDYLIVGGEVKNVFEPVQVKGHMKEKDHDEYDVLELVDVVTNKVVLSVGTGNTDDYYPYFVGRFYPENLVINKSI
jgi:hypothetical protein